MYGNGKFMFTVMLDKGSQIERLINRLEVVPYISISDEEINSVGLKLIDSIIRESLNSNVRCLFYCFAVSPVWLKERFTSKQIEFFDFRGEEIDSCSLFSSISEKLQGSALFLLVIDSLNDILDLSVKEACRLLSMLTSLARERKGTVITLYHSYIPPIASNPENEPSLDISAILRSLSAASIQVLPIKDFCISKVYTELRKRSGKVIREKCRITFQSGDHLVCIPESGKSQSEESIEVEEGVLAEFTTFRLGLNENEREARRKVILPHMEAQKVTFTSDTHIHYHLDSADDFDEEDPDDDLMI